MQTAEPPVHSRRRGWARTAAKSYHMRANALCCTVGPSSSSGLRKFSSSQVSLVRPGCTPTLGAGGAEPSFHDLVRVSPSLDFLSSPHDGQWCRLEVRQRLLAPPYCHERKVEHAPMAKLKYGNSARSDVKNDQRNGFYA